MERGGVGVLVGSLRLSDSQTQGDIMGSLLSLSLLPGASRVIVEEGGIEAHVEVLRSGSLAAKESAAAVLFVLSAEEEEQLRVQDAGAVPWLVEVLERGSVRGRKDAALVLFNLSRNRKGSVEIVSEGTVGVLVRMLASPAGEQGLEEKSMAVLANLCRTREGCLELLACGTLPPLWLWYATGRTGHKRIVPWLCSCWRPMSRRAAQPSFVAGPCRRCRSSRCWGPSARGARPPLCLGSFLQARGDACFSSLLQTPQIPQIGY